MGTLEGHIEYVSSVSFSPDGKLLASGSGDGSIKLWRVDRKEFVRTLQGHSGVVHSVAFNNAGLLASGSQDRSIKLWNTDTKECVGILTGHAGVVHSVAFNNAGLLASGGGVRELASGGGGVWDNPIKLWRVDTKECVGTLEGHTDRVHSVAFNSAGLLASGSMDRSIKLWNTSTKECVGTLTVHTCFVHSLAFNNAVLASGSMVRSIKLTHIFTRKFIMTGLLAMKRHGLIADIRDLIMMKVGAIDKNYKRIGGTCSVE